MFDRIVQHAIDPIIVAEIDPKAGPGFRIIYANEAFSRIFGYAAEEMLGRSPRMLQGPETCAETIEEISNVIHRGMTIRRRILNYTKAQQPVWIGVSIVPLDSPDGKVRRYRARYHRRCRARASPCGDGVRRPVDQAGQPPLLRPDA
jgi:PAS domain S-box-containing protein